MLDKMHLWPDPQGLFPCLNHRSLVPHLILAQSQDEFKPPNDLNALLEGTFLLPDLLPQWNMFGRRHFSYSSAEPSSKIVLLWKCSVSPFTNGQFVSECYGSVSESAHRFGWSMLLISSCASIYSKSSRREWMNWIVEDGDGRGHSSFAKPLCALRVFPRRWHPWTLDFNCIISWKQQSWQCVCRVKWGYRKLPYTELSQASS